jgi:hypothetical protein
MPFSSLDSIGSSSKDQDSCSASGGSAVESPVCILKSVKDTFLSSSEKVFSYSPPCSFHSLSGFSVYT